MANNTNTVLDLRQPGSTPSASEQKLGNVSVYGTGGVPGGQATNNLTGSNTITSRDSGNILGTVPPGKAGLKLVTGTIQQATYPIVVSAASVGKSSNMPDNVLPSDMSAAQVTVVQPAGAQGPCTPNAAQFDSVGKSLAPQHE